MNNNEALYSQIRAHIAFEHMVMAALTAAAASGAVVFVFHNLEAIVGARWSYMALFGAVYAAVRFSLVAFLIGFFASVVIGLPLFLTLERIKMRKVWPYVAAGAAVELVAAGFVLKHVPLVTDFLTFDDAPLLLPGVLAGVLFGRRIRPVWKAAERTIAPAYPFGGTGLLH